MRHHLSVCKASRRKKLAVSINLAAGLQDGRLRTTRDAHFRIALRLLDADAEGADWREAARVALHLDPEHESDRARRAFESHLSRAKWMTERGYRHLLRGGASA
jgi:hypothetical protein